jgi:osmotically-inducible protein OsmY
MNRYTNQLFPTGTPVSRPGHWCLVFVALALLVTGCVGGAQRTPVQSQADRELSDRVRIALNADGVYSFQHVHVEVDGGRVYLGGYVWRGDAILRAEDVASRVPGVTSVVVAQLELQRR